MRKILKRKLNSFIKICFAKKLIIPIFSCQTQINYCSSSPCVNGGNCIPIVNSYACSCPSGYYGYNCQFSYQACGSSPCRNGGTCVQTNFGQGYTCTCATGYTGNNCENLQNICTASSCLNGGTCYTVNVSLVVLLKIKIIRKIFK